VVKKRGNEKRESRKRVRESKRVREREREREREKKEKKEREMTHTPVKSCRASEEATPCSGAAAPSWVWGALASRLAFR
jgi:hypothetical protein